MKVLLFRPCDDNSLAMDGRIPERGNMELLIEYVEKKNEESDIGWNSDGLIRGYRGRICRNRVHACLSVW